MIVITGLYEPLAGKAKLNEQAGNRAAQGRKAGKKPAGAFGLIQKRDQFFDLLAVFPVLLNESVDLHFQRFDALVLVMRHRRPPLWIGQTRPSVMMVMDGPFHGLSVTGAGAALLAPPRLAYFVRGGPQTDSRRLLLNLA